MAEVVVAAAVVVAAEVEAAVTAVEKVVTSLGNALREAVVVADEVVVAAVDATKSLPYCAIWEFLSPLDVFKKNRSIIIPTALFNPSVIPVQIIILSLVLLVKINAEVKGQLAC